MNAIGLNPIKLDAIGLDPIRMNAIRLGVPVASSGSGRPYIDPELLSHVKMAISTWGKTNDDPDRAVLKDLTPNGNDMRLLNFGFAENSGYGLYRGDFTNDYESKLSESSVYELQKNKMILTYTTISAGEMMLLSKLESSNASITKLKISGLEKGFYLTVITDSYNSTYIGVDGIYSFSEADGPKLIILKSEGDEGHFRGKLIIEQIPDFEGWLCTDGVDDIIESVKPVSEMLEGSNEITVVSVIHQITLSNSNKSYNNNIRTGATNLNIARNDIFEEDKTGIYGYTIKDLYATTTALKGASLINNILGDKKDSTLIIDVNALTSDAYFSINGWKGSSLARIAYAGGFIANKVLTTDEINQVIAYYNLDRPGKIIKPQLYCNIKKQGITNDNHTEFNDQLIDFVGGHNIQLNNIGWEGESGINSYPVVFGANKTWNIIQANDSSWNYELTHNTIKVTKTISDTAFTYSYVYRNGIIQVEIPSFEVKITGIKTGQHVVYYYVAENNPSTVTRKYLDKDGIYTLPRSVNLAPVETPTRDLWIGFRINTNDIDLDITIEVLPTIEHALSLDGINDFGKVTGLPVLKDYTVAVDYVRLAKKLSSIGDSSILTKNSISGIGAFVLNSVNASGSNSSYSFGLNNIVKIEDTERMIYYQSKYSNQGQAINAGSAEDSTSMWLGTMRDNDSRFIKAAVRFLMLFPYSLSEFLLERQLRKYKAGTLYPDMIEFRPIVKSNIPYSSISYSVNPGDYVTEGSAVTITITLSNASDKLIGVSSNAISDISISGDNGTYEITGKVTKSPQKISIVISSYLTMLGNDTLISNETLIKNE